MPGNKFGPKRTLASDNQFTFTCPVFEVPTKIAACWELESRWKVGERPEVRKGCQVAMECGKCPLNTIAWHMIRTGEDPYHATDTNLRKLSQDHLDRVRPVLIRDDVMRRYDLSPAEQSRLALANENATSVKGIRRGKIKPKENKRATTVPDGSAMPVTDRDAVKAAISGDMSAAINKEIEERSK